MVHIVVLTYSVCNYKYLNKKTEFMQKSKYNVKPGHTYNRRTDTYK